MGNLTSARLLRLAALAACSLPACSGNQTFDDGSDELGRDGVPAQATTGSQDSVDAGPGAPDSANAADDVVNPEPSVVNDAGARPSSEVSDEVTSVEDAASPGAPSQTAESTETDATETELTEVDVSSLVDAGSGAPSPADAGSAVTGRDIAGEVLGLTYADGLFVAVGSNGEASGAGPGTSWLITSPDGRKWTERLAEAEGLLWSVAHTAGRWIAVGWDVGTQPVFISDDGSNWQWVPVEGPLQPQQVVSVPEGFLLLDSSDASIWFSENGEEWAPRLSPGPVTYLLVAEDGLSTSAGEIFAGRSDGIVSLSTDFAASWEDEALPEAEVAVDRLWMHPGYLQGSGHSDSCNGAQPSCRTDFFLGRDPSSAAWFAQEKGDSQPYWPSNTLVDGIEVATDGQRLAHRNAVNAEWTLVEADYNLEARFSEVAFGDGTFVFAGAGGLRYSDDGKVWLRYDSIVSE